MVRYGYWNRRGDYLTTGKYIVYAPPDRMYPLELENYPHSMEGYKDHHGNFIKYDPTHKKLPTKLPRDKQTLMMPYDHVSSVL